VGESLARLMAGDPVGVQALHPLRPVRFTEDEPLQNQYSWGTIV